MIAGGLQIARKVIIRSIALVNVMLKKELNGSLKVIQKIFHGD